MWDSDAGADSPSRDWPFVLLTRTLVAYHTITEQHHFRVMGGLVFPNSVFNIDLSFTFYDLLLQPPPSPLDPRLYRLTHQPCNDPTTSESRLAVHIDPRLALELGLKSLSI